MILAVCEYRQARLGEFQVSDSAARPYADPFLVFLTLPALIAGFMRLLSLTRRFVARFGRTKAVSLTWNLLVQNKHFFIRRSYPRTLLNACPVSLILNISQRAAY